MKDLTYLYMPMSMIELRQKRSIKYLRMVKLENMKGGFFVTQEIMQLRSQITQIDAAIEAKRLQKTLF